MTQGLETLLNLPEMEDVLKGTMPPNATASNDADEEIEEEIDPEFESVLSLAEAASERLALVDGKDHAEAMDTLYGETLKHARDVMELGFNIDQMKAARMFEVATGLYAKAMDAKNSKRDAQLKTMKLALEQRRIDLIEEQVRHELGGASNTLTGDSTVIVADRNELLRKMREKSKDSD